MFIDSHCHLELEEYDKDRESIIELAHQSGISYMLTVATEERYFRKVIELTETYPTIYGVVGIHPHNARSYSDALEEVIRGHLKHPKIVGYGEIGLDFYRDYAPRATQVEVFRRQIEIARAASLPLIIHSRNAREETLDVLRETRPGDHNTIIHCYSYDLSTARILLDMGMYLSVPGTITYKNSELPEIVRYVPLDRLLSETDAPFLTPQPHRGKRNQPAYVKLVVEEIARLKGMAVEEVATVLTATFSALFLAGRKEVA